VPFQAANIEVRAPRADDPTLLALAKYQGISLEELAGDSKPVQSSAALPAQLNEAPAPAVVDEASTAVVVDTAPENVEEAGAEKSERATTTLADKSKCGELPSTDAAEQSMTTSTTERRHHIQVLALRC
jgi:hypothetical protein